MASGMSKITDGYRSTGAHTWLSRHTLVKATAIEPRNGAIEMTDFTTDVTVTIHGTEMDLVAVGEEFARPSRMLGNHEPLH